MSASFPRSRAVAIGVAAALLALTATTDAAVGSPSRVPPVASAVDAGWQWPVDPFRLARPYQAPAHRYGPGHRGVDLAPESPQVRAPAAGVVAFAGPVVDREVLTIDHGDGFVTTLEPVKASVSVGETVAAGAPVGVVSEGGHAEAGTLHFGVRLRGEYLNPFALVGGVPRAVLLPCC